MLAGRLVDHAMERGAPTKNEAPAAGLVRVTAGTASAKLALVLEIVAGGEMVVTRTRASAASGPTTGPLKIPVLNAEFVIVWKVDPPSRLSSMRTKAPLPRLLVQVTVSDGVNTVAPAVGAVTVKVGVRITKLLLVPLAGREPLEVTRARALTTFGPVTSQLKEPVLGAESASVSKVLPPSRLSSMRTVPPAGRLWNQEMFVEVPTYTVEDGDDTVIDGVIRLKVDSAEAVWAVLSCAVTRTRTVELAGPGDGHTHSLAVAGSPVQPGIGV